jgi:RNA polymerase sigma-70 factor (ECF subfamily)
MSGNRTDAEDALSKASLKAHDRYLRDAPRIKNLRSWFARVLHNLCMDEYRRRAVCNRVLDRLHPDQLSALVSVRAYPGDPEDQLIVEGSMESAVDVIMKMPDRLRHPFVLRFIYQYSNQEIARHLDLTEVNVRKRIQLGRVEMRKHLDPL